MKANVAVPSLQLLGDGVSVSSSSQSVCSTMSSFRDPLLASFEEELLNSTPKQAAAKTQTSWSKMKGLMCSPRQGGRSNSLGGNLNSCAIPYCNQGEGVGRFAGWGGRSNSHPGNVTIPIGGMERRTITVSISQDSETSAVSYRSSNVCHTYDLSDFAESLTRRLLSEALTEICCSKLETDDSVTSRRTMAVSVYSDLLAQNVLKAVMATLEMTGSDWLEQNKVVTWSDEVENVQQFSVAVTSDRPSRQVTR